MDASKLSKHLLKSRTFWLNAALVLASILGILLEGDVLPPHIVPWVAAIAAVANIVLRAVTSQPVRFRRISRDKSSTTASVHEVGEAAANALASGAVSPDKPLSPEKGAE